MDENLIRQALEARKRAYAPFSKFLVGAALATADGRIITGCNVESASYGLTICAERTAVFSAVEQGFREFKAICVAADTVELTPPCGACRQIIWEFCGDIPVLLVNLKGDRKDFTSRELLPEPFDRRQLRED